jgi:hypothetical protein
MLAAVAVHPVAQIGYRATSNLVIARSSLCGLRIELKCKNIRLGLRCLLVTSSASRTEILIR